jgi:ubiquitin carboxyl-terminal hydrolase 4/11
LSESEQLEAGNEWFCSNCKEHKLANKEMSIYRAPKVLILHLKRFKQKGLIRKEKN